MLPKSIILSVLCFSFMFISSCSFLLDGATPSTNSGLTDKHYIAVMDLLLEERNARQQLEQYVTQLHRELVAKTSNISSATGSGQTCMDCTNRIQKMELDLIDLQHKYISVLSVNTDLKNKYDKLLGNVSHWQAENANIKVENQNVSNQLQIALSEINSLKQLKSIDQIQTLQTVERDTLALKQQVNALQNAQLARSQDFLALYNQTVVNKAENVAMKEELLKQHNQSVHELQMNLNNSVVAVSSTITQLRTQVDHDSQARGTTYVRWSRTQCPNDADLVYAGYAGGGRFNEEGSAAEPVCLPKDPEFNKTSGTDTGRMYGVEFNSNLFASNSENQDVPCAVCRTHSSSSVIMIPGKTSCYTGWKREYYGYLASGDVGHQSASAYVCVDISPEYVPGGSAWNGLSKLFYEVVAKCGSLKCPPYHQNYPLTCVVCSR